MSDVKTAAVPVWHRVAQSEEGNWPAPAFLTASMESAWGQFV